MLHVGHSGSMRKQHESALSCLRHAADTAPLEGSLVLRCAIYDPLERLQISKMRLSEMGVWDLIFWCVAHAVVSSFGGGVLTSLTSTSLTLWNMYTLRMLSYDHQGGGGGINVLDKYFPYVTAHAHVAHAVV